MQWGAFDLRDEELQHHDLAHRSMKMCIRARNARVHVGLQVYMAFPFCVYGIEHRELRACAVSSVYVQPLGKAGRKAQLLFFSPGGVRLQVLWLYMASLVKPSGSKTNYTGKTPYEPT
jgi:hypothetical protein